MDLEEYRREIDRIDGQLVSLFCERMDIAAKIAAWKKEQGRPVYDPERERKKLLEIAASVPEEMQEYTASLYSQLFELSRSYQNRLLGTATELTAQL
ncbi:MAG: chorismate mutase [Eubacteriales bacterium]|nr:chorismate mutase [Eubacteriales bacterium]